MGTNENTPKQLDPLACPQRSRRFVWTGALFAISALLVLACVSGCGNRGNGMVYVSGKVTFDGAPPPAVGVITFQPLEAAEGFSRRPARASFGIDGAFEATSIHEGDGLVPGKYSVLVSCNSGQPDPKSPTPWEDITYISPKYEPETLSIEPGSDAVTLNLDLPLKK